MDVKYHTIEDVIRANVTFLIQSTDGWNRLYCELPDCMDGSRTKGPRAGFVLNGDNIGFHCFNCGVGIKHEDSGEGISTKMLNVLEAFGVPKKDILHVVNAKRVKTPNKKKDKSARPKPQFKTLQIPDHFYKLSEASEDNVIAQNAIAFIEKKKFIKADEYPFYLSTATTKNPDPKEINKAKSMRNRLIIPAFRNDKMIYYIGRSLDEDNVKKYLNAPIPKTNIIYGMDNLYKNQESILFVTEGFFDSFHLKGVAVLENHMTKDQIELLNSSPRRKVVVPDRHGDSRKLAEQAINLGWGISVPEWGDCIDVCESILKYGKLLTLDMIMKSIKEGPKAKLHLNFV
jgi:hypothetical protein